MKPNILAILLMIGIAITACNNNEPETRTEKVNPKQLISAFNAYKAEKDSSFRFARWSPLTDSAKVHFMGLSYFEYDPSWRYEGPIHRYKNPDSILIMGTRHGKGRNDLRPALKYGYFAFERDGKEYRLEIIKILPSGPGGKPHLFLGFWDETSGRETYAGGRYIEMRKSGENRYIVDFNYAYNPFCAYNHEYSCAIPPLENRLDIAVNAGEKNYSAH